MRLRTLCEQWPKSYLQDTDLIAQLGGTKDARYGAVKRALKAGWLVRLRRGLYIIRLPKTPLPDAYELAQVVYGPSYVSLESALSYHGWIPEGVYTTTSVTYRRRREFQTPLGIFRYDTTPLYNFFDEVIRVSNQTTLFLMAKPWKAIADLCYTRKRIWNSLEELSEDLRIEPEVMAQGLESLKKLALQYPSRRVRAILENLWTSQSNCQPNKLTSNKLTSNKLT